MMNRGHGQVVGACVGETCWWGKKRGERISEM